MNIITQTQQTQAFTHHIDDDERASGSTAGIIPEQPTAQRSSPSPILATKAVPPPVYSYYDIFNGRSRPMPQRKSRTTSQPGTKVKAHKRRRRSAKKPPASTPKENSPMEECNRKAIATLKTQQLFEIKARFASNF